VSRRDVVSERVEQLVRQQHDEACRRLERARTELAEVDANRDRLSARVSGLEAEVAGWEARIEGDS
jgi:phage shock protein A